MKAEYETAEPNRMTAPETYDNQNPIPASATIFVPSNSHMENSDVRIMMTTPRKKVRNGRRSLGLTMYTADNPAATMAMTRMITGKNFWKPSKGQSMKSIPVIPEAHTLITENIPINAPTIEMPAIYPGKFMLRIPDEKL